jgi:hypothetical protein
MATQSGIKACLDVAALITDAEESLRGLGMKGSSVIAGSTGTFSPVRASHASIRSKR